MWTKVLALQKCMVYIGLFHPCEHRANICDKDQGIELAFSIALAGPNFLTTQRLSAFAQCPQLPEASRRSTGVKSDLFSGSEDRAGCAEEFRWSPSLPELTLA